MSLLSGSRIFQDNGIIVHNEEELFDKVFQDTGDDELYILTQKALKIICHAILIILRRQRNFAEQQKKQQSSFLY